MKFQSRLEKNIKDASTQISKLKKDVADKETESTERNARIKVLEKDIAVKVDEFTALQVTNKKYIKASHDLNQQCQVLEKKFQNSETESQNLRYELSLKMLDENEIKKKLEEAKNEYSSELRLLKNNIAERDQSTKELRMVVDKKDKNIEELQNRETELKKKLSDLEVKYVDSVAQKEKIVQEKDVELQVQAKLHDKKLQELFIEFSEKLHFKDLLLRDKALDHEKKLSATTAEYSNILQTKEDALLSLNSKLSEKDIHITDIEKSLQLAYVRINEVKKDYERQLEEKSILDINNQNNMRYDLLVQQQNMKRDLTNEMELERKTVIELCNKKVSDLEAESAQTVQVLVKQLNAKKLLIKKLKNTLLYRPSQDSGRERYWSQGPQLMLDYCWPVVHLHGVPENPINLKEFFFFQMKVFLSCFKLEYHVSLQIST